MIIAKSKKTPKKYYDGDKQMAQTGSMGGNSGLFLGMTK